MCPNQMTHPLFVFATSQASKPPQRGKMMSAKGDGPELKAFCLFGAFRAPLDAKVRIRSVKSQFYKNRLSFKPDNTTFVKIFPRETRSNSLFFVLWHFST